MTSKIQYQLVNILTSSFGWSTYHITTIKNGSNKNKMNVYEITIDNDNLHLTKGLNYYAFTTNKLTDLFINCNSLYYKENYHYLAASIINLTITERHTYLQNKCANLINLPNKLTKLNLIDLRFKNIKIKQKIKTLILNNIHIIDKHNTFIKADNIIIRNGGDNYNFNVYNTKELSLYCENIGKFLNFEKINSCVKTLHLYFYSKVKSITLPNKLEELTLNIKKYKRSDVLFYEKHMVYDMFHLLSYKQIINITECINKITILFILFIMSNILLFENKGRISLFIFLFLILMKNITCLYYFKKNNVNKIIKIININNDDILFNDDILLNDKEHIFNKKMGFISFFEYKIISKILNMKIINKIYYIYENKIQYNMSYRWYNMLSLDNILIVIILIEWIYLLYHMYNYLIILNIIIHLIEGFCVKITKDLINDDLSIKNIPKNLEKITAPIEYKKQFIKFENKINIKYFY